MCKERWLIFGLGAQAKYAVDILKYRKNALLEGLIDIKPEAGQMPPDFCGTQVLGGLEHGLTFLQEKGIKVIVCHSDPVLKADVAGKINERGGTIESLVHPSAVVSHTAVVGKGTIINAGAVIQPYAKIGDGVMIHATCVVEHDGQVQDYANLAPGVKLAGWVTIGKYATVYTGACVIPGVKIGVKAVVAAGAVVTKDVPEGMTVRGVPAAIWEKQ